MFVQANICRRSMLCLGLQFSLGLFSLFRRQLRGKNASSRARSEAEYRLAHLTGQVYFGMFPCQVDVEFGLNCLFDTPHNNNNKSLHIRWRANELKRFGLYRPTCRQPVRGSDALNPFTLDEPGCAAIKRGQGQSSSTPNRQAELDVVICLFIFRSLCLARATDGCESQPTRDKKPQALLSILKPRKKIPRRNLVLAKIAVTQVELLVLHRV